MNEQSVTLLGVKGGPAIRPGSSMPTSILVRMGGQTILVDAGLGAAAGVVRAGFALTEIDAVLITHLHSDHYLELGPLLHTAWTAGLKRPVPVYGPTGLPAYWCGFLNSMTFDIETRIKDEGRPDFEALVPLNEIREDAPLTIGTVAVTAMRNRHPPIEESYALRFEAGDRTLVLSGDTAPMPEMAAFARNADLLVHEAMLRDGIKALCDRMGYEDDRLFDHIMRSHTTAGDAARIAAQAGVKSLALNHLIPDGEADQTEETWRAAVASHFHGTVHIGRDGMTIPLQAAA